MLASVRAFLEHLIDYAGMFPPARLPLRQALRHYTQLAATPESWMLGRFVCAAAQLEELLAAARTDGSPAALAVSVLGRGGADWSDVWPRLDADLDALEKFRNAAGPPHSADALELTLPPSINVTEARQLTWYVLPFFQLPAFIEIPFGGAWQSDAKLLIDVLGQERVTPAVGMKIRCGGAVTPTIEQLAWFIAACREAQVPWKATAGLHHPLHHYDAQAQNAAHGFINVFAAGILAQVHDLAPSELAAILAEETIDAFRLSEDGFGWLQWQCTVEQIRGARRLMPSFGSCSFDEPRDDLRQLGLLP